MTETPEQIIGRLSADVSRLTRERDRMAEGIKVQAAAVRTLDLKERTEYLATESLYSERAMDAALTAEVERLTLDLSIRDTQRESLLQNLREVERERDERSVVIAVLRDEMHALEDDLREVGAALAEPEGEWLEVDEIIPAIKELQDDYDDVLVEMQGRAKQAEVRVTALEGQNAQLLMLLTLWRREDALHALRFQDLVGLRQTTDAVLTPKADAALTPGGGK
jgi:chromosome segregation ATPase